MGESAYPGGFWTPPGRAFPPIFGNSVFFLSFFYIKRSQKTHDCLLNFNLARIRESLGGHHHFGPIPKFPRFLVWKASLIGLMLSVGGLIFVSCRNARMNKIINSLIFRMDRESSRNILYLFNFFVSREILQRQCWIWKLVLLCSEFNLLALMSFLITTCSSSVARIHWKSKKVY